MSSIHPYIYLGWPYFVVNPTLYLRCVRVLPRQRSYTLQYIMSIQAYFACCLGSLLIAQAVRLLPSQRSYIMPIQASFPPFPSLPLLQPFIVSQRPFGHILGFQRGGSQCQSRNRVPKNYSFTGFDPSTRPHGAYVCSRTLPLDQS